MACEKNFITIKSNWHSYLIFSPAKCVYKTPTETGLLMPNSQNYTCFGTEEQTARIEILKKILVGRTASCDTLGQSKLNIDGVNCKMLCHFAPAHNKDKW